MFGWLSWSYIVIRPKYSLAWWNDSDKKESLRQCPGWVSSFYIYLSESPRNSKSPLLRLLFDNFPENISEKCVPLSVRLFCFGLFSNLWTVQQQKQNNIFAGSCEQKAKMWYFPEIPESSGWLIIKSLLLWHPGWQVNVWKSVWHGAIVQHWVEWKLYHTSCPSAILSLPGCRTRSTSVGCLPWPQTSTWRWTASPTITGAGGVRTTTSPPGEDETPFKSLKIPFSPHWLRFIFTQLIFSHAYRVVTSILLLFFFASDIIDFVSQFLTHHVNVAPLQLRSV